MFNLELISIVRHNFLNIFICASHKKKLSHSWNKYIFNDKPLNILFLYIIYKILVILKDNRCVGAERNTPSDGHCCPVRTNHGRLNAILIKIRSFGPLLKDLTKPHTKVKYVNLSIMMIAMLCQGVSCPLIV